jgi:hypothetical protein
MDCRAERPVAICLGHDLTFHVGYATLSHSLRAAAFLILSSTTD